MKSLPVLVKLEKLFPGSATVVLPRMKPVLYSQGDVMLSPWICAREVTFITEGTCACVHNVEDAKTIREYRAGEWFGEVRDSCKPLKH